METLVTVVAIMAIAIGLVTLVGHGIWVLLAALFRGPPSTARPSIATATCPRCSARLKGNRCSVCDWPTPLTQRDRTPEALSATREQVERFLQLGLINQDVHRRLLEALEAERRRMLNPSLVPEAVALESTETTQAQLPFGTPAIVRTLPPTSLLGAEPLVVVTPPSPLDEYAVAPLEQPVELPQRSPEERVRQYAASQAEAKSLIESPGESAEDAEQRIPPGTRLSKLLATFMAEKNIRWGELVGGLLIVCCSIALVISFWAKIAERPFLKFFVFNGVTAALFGLGLYSAHRWKLRTTSQAVLTISILLVPLNFLAIAAFSQVNPSSLVLTVAGEATSVLLFAALSFLAGRMVTPQTPWLLVTGIIWPSVVQLLVRRWVDPATDPARLLGLGAAPLIGYAAVNGLALWRQRRLTAEQAPPVTETLRLWGTSTFAAFLPLGLLLFKTGRAEAALHQLAVLVSGCGLPSLAVGLFLWRRLLDKHLSGLRTAALSIAVAGAAVLVAGVVLAWPSPMAMLPAAIFAAATLIVIAVAFNLAEAHLAAVACLALAYLTGWHLATGRLAWQEQDSRHAIEVLISGVSGQALSALAVLLFAIAAVVERWCRRAADGRALALGSAGVAAASIGLISWFGFAVPGDPLHVTWILAFFGLATCLTAARRPHPSALWIGAALILAASVQGVVYLAAVQWPLAMPWATAFALDAMLMVAATTVCHRWGERLGLQQAAQVFGKWALGASVVMLGLVSAASVGVLEAASAAPLAIHWFWLALIWLGLALTGIWPPLFIAFQLALTMAVWFGVGNWLETRDWFLAAERRWLDPWALQSEGIAIAILSLGWIALRWSMTRGLVTARAANEALPISPASPGTTLATLVSSERLAADRIVLRIVLVVLVGLGFYAAWPGIAQELSPHNSVVNAIATRGALPPAEFEFLGISHVHAAGWGGWLLMALVAIALGAEMAARRESTNVPSLVLTLSVACPLAGSWWASDFAVASATRWLGAIFMVGGSALVIAFWRRARWWQRHGSVTDRVPQLSYDHRSPFVPTAFGMALMPLLILVPLTLANRSNGDAPQTLVGWMLPLFIIWVLSVLAIALIPGWSNHLAPARRGAAAVAKGSLEEWTKLLLFLLGGVPALATAWYVVGAAVAQAPIAGPAPDSLFGQMGAAASYSVPIVLAAVVLLGYGIWERSGRLILAAGIVGNCAATTAYLLGLANPGLYLDIARWIGLAQLNAIVAAACSLTWMGQSSWIARQRTAAGPRADWPQLIQVGIAAACNAAVLLPAWLTLIRDPSRSQALLEVADVWGWSAGLLTAAAILAVSRFANATVRSGLWAVLLAGAATLIAWTASRWDAGNWLAFHVLLVCHVAAAWLVAAAGWLGARRFAGRTWATNLSLIGLALAVAIGLRALDRDPGAPWWTLGALVTQAMLAVWLAWWSLRRGLLYVAALLINLTASIWWWHHTRFSGGLNLAELIEINVVALASPAVVWLLIELRRFRAHSELLAAEETLAPRFIPLHRSAARLSLAALGLIVGVRLGLTAIHAYGPSPVPILEWLALGATAVAAFAGLWDADARDSIAVVYFLGLIAAGVLLDQLQLEPKWLWWSGDILLAAYALATSCLWWRRAGLRAIADLLHIPRGGDRRLSELPWLVPLNCTVVMIVVVLSYGFVLEFDDYALRLLAAKAVLFQMATVGLLAQGEKRWRLQYCALMLGAVGGIALGWAGLEPGTSGMILNRAVVVAAALAATAVVYGLGLSKLLGAENEWLRAAKRLVPVLVAADACAVLFVLGTEGLEVFGSGHVTMLPAAIITVGAVLLGLCAACLSAAVLPGRDPLGLSELGRSAYVYAAEVLLALLFVHIRLTKPEWFHGFFERYWPLVVQAIAFVGVGVGEWFRRRRWTVVGEPLETTGAFLPLLPVIGFWILPTGVDYSLLLLAVGLLYAALSMARRSFGFGLLALAAANGSLWYFLGRQEGYRLLDHPQLWLIPPALCVLVAAHLNRRQLSAAQMTAIRYGASIVLYVSSTADIFLQGVSHAPWLPLVLGGLSLLGVFAGIILRVRAFLILGTSFLLLALLTIIWYAAVDLQQTWLWSATGIVTGVLILIVFAVFEKQRQAVFKLVDKLREWQP